MAFSSDLVARLAPATMVAEAIAISLAGIAILLAFIVARRFLRARYFAARERHMFNFRQQWDDVLNGVIAPHVWRFDRVACEVIQTMLLDSIEASTDQELPRLINCLRRSGLLDKLLQEARSQNGWRRRKALVLLGRTRAREAVGVLEQALDSPDSETRIAAVRGLGKLGLPEAVVPLLERLCQSRLPVPPAVIRNALLNGCSRNVSVLLRYLRIANGAEKELLARVAAEIPESFTYEDALVLASDASAELRASAARALAHAPSGMAIPELAALSSDPEWFVRLRAVISLGLFSESAAVLVLVRALRDRNRHVRQRAAWSLLKSEQSVVPVLRQVVDTGDTYGIQAVVAELERSGRYRAVLSELSRIGNRESERLSLALQNAWSRLGSAAQPEHQPAEAQAAQVS